MKRKYAKIAIALAAAVTISTPGAVIPGNTEMVMADESTTRSTISSTTPPTSSTASAAPPTTPPRRSATARSRWTRAKHCAKSSTASTPTVLRRRSSSTCPSTGSISPGPASSSSSPAWTGTTLCTWPTASAARICGSGRTASGSCATPPTRATARCCGATPGAPTTRCDQNAKGNCRALAPQAPRTQFWTKFPWHCPRRRRNLRPKRRTLRPGWPPKRACGDGFP